MRRPLVIPVPVSTTTRVRVWTPPRNVRVALRALQLGVLAGSLMTAWQVGSFLGAF